MFRGSWEGDKGKEDGPWSLQGTEASHPEKAASDAAGLLRGASGHFKESVPYPDNSREVEKALKQRTGMTQTVF